LDPFPPRAAGIRAMRPQGDLFVPAHEPAGRQALATALAEPLRTGAAPAAGPRRTTLVRPMVVAMLAGTAAHRKRANWCRACILQ